MVSIEGTKNQAFIVGDNGQVYITGLNPDTALVAQWGTQDRCAIKYRYPEAEPKNGLALVNAYADNKEVAPCLAIYTSQCY
jgi:outer membrane usher protein